MKNALLMMAGACVFAAGAAVTPASILGDGMVLQRDKPVRVWGKAAAGEAVTVAFAGRTAQTQAAADSPTLKTWKIEGDRFVLSFNGADGKWVKAQIVNLSVDRRSNRSGGVINGRDLIVSAPGVAAPKKLRYLYSRPWFGAVYSDAGLPLGAFHIGD